MSDLPVIHLSGINIYQGKRAVLTDVELNINSGEFVYLIGKTGSGKSSLLKLIYADLPVNEGIATSLGYNLAAIKKKAKYQFFEENLALFSRIFSCLMTAV